VTIDTMIAMQDEFRSAFPHTATPDRGFIVVRYDILLKYKQNCPQPLC